MDLEFQTGRGEEMTSIRAGPHVMDLPTLGDLYDRAMGNRPVVGMNGNSLTWGMVGHGSQLDGGDRDIAMLHGGATWEVTPHQEPYFEFPAYLEEVPGLDEAVRRVDLEDGRLDGVWLGEDILDDPAALVDTPAFPGYQNRVIRESIRREGFGRDAVPDLLFVNYKQIDKVGHRWSMNSPQMEQVLRADDDALAGLVRILDREVGRGRWVLFLTADHGSTPDATFSGGYEIDILDFTNDLLARFDGDGDETRVIHDMRVTQFWVDEGELAEKGFTLDDVAAFVMRYTEGDNVADPSTLPRPERNARVFEAAFPGPALEAAPCLRGRQGA